MEWLLLLSKKFNVMKSKLFLISIFLLFSACYSTKITSDFLIPENQNTELFSKLDLTFDEYSFSSIFMPSEKVYDSEIYNGKIESQREIEIILESKNAVEVKNLLEKYINQHSFYNQNRNVGTIEFAVRYFDFQPKTSLYTASIASFGVLNLLGLPTGGGKHIIELQAIIYNEKGRIVRKYSGFGQDNYLTGLYYHSPNQKRPSYIKSIKAAIAEIDIKISSDKELMEELYASL